jgi:hypothetical protein
MTKVRAPRVSQWPRVAKAADGTRLARHGQPIFAGHAWWVTYVPADEEDDYRIFERSHEGRVIQVHR